ncbi:hypothetical protein HHI36_013938 [Cryptolaemus montrouzieri]|uniref:Ribosomal protein L1 n=1 Tax=Cryptolaemus montrouzieri TaxID=559131 RepID=A0ABD2N1A4_9CUCU
MVIMKTKTKSTPRKRKLEEEVISSLPPKKGRDKSINRNEDVVTPKHEKKVENAQKKTKSTKVKSKVKKNFVALKCYDERVEEISTKYSIPIDLVETNVSNIVKLVEDNPKLKNSLFTERFPIFLQLNVWKIPKCNPTLIRIQLEHSLLDTDDEVCLIVPDVKGIKNKEYEQHIEHYEEILKQKEVTGIKKIMTLHQLKAEYESFELKRGLVELYDMFLVDGRISGRVVHHLGKIFYKKRKIPTPIKMDLGKIKNSIESAFKKSTFQVHSKGDSFMVQIGHSKMSTRELVENIFIAVENIDKQFPGGINNLKHINIYAQRGSSLPIYVALANPNTIIVPKVKVKKPKHCKDVEGELTTKLNHKVKVKPSGAIVVTQVNDQDD